MRTYVRMYSLHPYIYIRTYICIRTYTYVYFYTYVRTPPPTKTQKKTGPRMHTQTLHTTHPNPPHQSQINVTHWPPQGYATPPPNHLRTKQAYVTKQIHWPSHWPPANYATRGTSAHGLVGAYYPPAFQPRAPNVCQGVQPVFDPDGSLLFLGNQRRAKHERSRHVDPNGCRPR